MSDATNRNEDEGGGPGGGGGGGEDGDSGTPARRSCATMKTHRRLLDTVPRYAELRQRIEEQAFLAENMLSAQRSGCTKIPVVVHVVHRTPAENVSQAQIDSQIKVLNEDFRKKNADVSSVPAAFQPLAADARIVFELAKTGPDGAPTNGVVRVSTNVDGFSDDDAVKSSASGGSDAWPAAEYLNIWVCQLSGGLLGYAQFPGGPAATDGVVVLHTAFGTTGTAAAPFNKGRTTTHEVGHWLNLRHIWGDDGEGCSGSDFVADTPNQGGPNYGAPSFPTVSCTNGPNGDMFMNYMDYVDDAAMVMFTPGQVARMQAALDGPRGTIGTSVPCGGKNLVKELKKELPKEFAKEFGKDPIKETVKELKKETIKEGVKDFIKDKPKELINDPPKRIFENPKNFIEQPDIPFPFNPGFGTLGGSGGGGGGGGGGAMPFTLGGGGARQEGPDPQQLLAAYQQLLSLLGQFAEAGLLDAQAQAFLQQLWSNYRQIASGQDGAQ